MLNKRFLIFLAIGLAIAGALTFSFYEGTKDRALAVNGEILKVRTTEISPRNTFMSADFRIRNTSGIDFMLKDATLFVTLADGKEKEGETTSRDDIDKIIKYFPVAGPKFNQVLIVRDRVPANVSIDRMVGATFSLSDQELTARKSVRLHLTDLDGKEFDLFERKSAQ